MPGANLPVQLARLPELSDGAFRAFVRFPAGWSRPSAGHYPVAEEFLVLEGELRLNAATWRGGGYAWLAANRVRADSCSEPGCLAFAWFAGMPRWIPGVPAKSGALRRHRSRSLAQRRRRQALRRPRASHLGVARTSDSRGMRSAGPRRPVLARGCPKRTACGPLERAGAGLVGIIAACGNCAISCAGPFACSACARDSGK